jgi:hypothetical protein
MRSHCRGGLVGAGRLQLRRGCTVCGHHPGDQHRGHRSPLLAHVDAAAGLGTVIGVIGGYQQGGVTDAISYAAALGLHIALYQAAITGS